MVRYRKSSDEWCVTLDVFKAMDPGKIWARLTGQRYSIPDSRKGVRGGMIG